MQDILHSALAAALPYPAYREMVTSLLLNGKTTGPNQTETYLAAATQNEARMNRLDRKARFSEEMEATLAKLKKSYLLLAITEGWCGDAAQIIPLINHMATASDQLELKLVLRDEHPELIDQFLTGGARSIPKVLFLDPATYKVLTSWGPRPAAAQEMAMAYKALPEEEKDYDAYNIDLHKWYARDKTVATQTELVAVLRGLEE